MPLSFDLNLSNFSFKELGPKGITYFFLNILFVALGIMCFIGVTPIGIVVAILAILLAVAGIYCVLSKNLTVLLAYIFFALVVGLLSVIAIFVILFANSYRGAPVFIGLALLFFLTPVAAYLAYDGRGKTFSMSPAAP